MKSFTTGLCWLLSLGAAVCQDFTFIQYGQKEGLRHSQILDISQDHHGNLWLGTATRSVYRFDGQRFFEYKIEPPDFVGTLYTFAVKVDSQGSVWVFSNLGLIRFDGKTSTLMPTNGNLTMGTHATLIITKEDRKWVIDEVGQLFFERGDTLIHHQKIQSTLNGPVAGYYFSNNNLSFYSASGSCVAVKPDGTWQHAPLPGAETGVQYVYAHQNRYYLVTSHEIVVVAENGRQLSRQPLGKLPGKVTRLLVDERNRIWGIAGNKLFVVPPNGSTQLVSGTSSLVKNDVIVLFQDKDGGVWISVDVLGIMKFHRRPWRKIPATAGIDITAMAEREDGSLCFGTYRHGLMLGQTTLLEGIPITSIARKADKLLVGTLRNGAFLVAGNRATQVFDKSINLDVHGVNAFGDSLMMGTNNGFFIRYRDQITKFQKPGESVGYSLPLRIGNTVYLTGSISGVMKLAQDSLQPIGPDFLKSSTVYTMRKQPSGRVAVTGEFSKVVWFDSALNYQQTTDLREIVSNILLFEELDETHWLVGSNDGLFKVTVEANRITAVRKYGRVDGYDEEELYVASSFYKQGEALYVGTVNGAYEFLLNNEELKWGTPITYLTYVEFQSHEPVARDKSYFQLPVNLTLAHNENAIVFSFAATSLSNPNNIQYRYRLEGVDQDWTHPGTSQKVTYTNLPPGEFVFTVQAVNENHIFGNVARYSFVVAPAFWQQPWFYFLVGGILILLVFLFVWAASAYRIRLHQRDEQLRQSEAARIRKQMSMDFHDEMGNKLAGMLAQASLQKVRHRGTDLESVFDLFERNAFTIFHGTKDFIWTIDVRSNNLREVIAYLRDFGHGFFDRNNIAFHVEENILDEHFNRPLPDGYNRQIILIFKEAMTNVLKHSRCQNVYFFVGLTATELHILFKDDGQLRAGSAYGNGIKNMQTRARRMDGTFTLMRDRDDRFTLASLQIPLKP